MDLKMEKGTEKTNNNPASVTSDGKTAQAIKEFMGNTSAHGWGHAVRSKHSTLRALWITFTLIALCANVTHVTMLVIQYLSYPFEQVSLVKLDEIPFPSVTVCSIQPVSLSSMYKQLNDTQTRFSQWNNMTHFYFDEMIDYDENDEKQRAMYERMRGPRGFFENIGDEVEQVGIQAHDLVLSCLFSMKGCSWRNFTLIETATYFNCYTFNGGDFPRDKLVAQTTGPQSGLSLVMYLENDNGDESQQMPYYTFMNIGNAAGARVVIHSPNTYPSPVDKGFDIPPGFSSSVGIEVSRLSRLGKPYSECHDVGNSLYPQSEYAYSDHECMQSCQQRLVMIKCGCISADLPHSDRHYDTGLFFCGHFNQSNPYDIFNKTSCEQRTRESFSTDPGVRKNCTCNAPCLEFQYDSDVSYSYWPIDSTQRSFFNHYLKENPNRESMKAWHNLKHFNQSSLIQGDMIRKNFVRLNVYFKSLILREYKQQGSYNFFTLFSDIGGTFGLWIGMSLLTWGEVIELGITLFLRLVGRQQRKNAVTVD